ncbi:unnamed protein product [Darwinula stevensoni]|uniref:Uncharacterized protein n=1 Tax=Darwinula stevensoni TaxID=69355 RepID=A0A7R9AHK3_9CRUS|nr:unnamed protein product [Darwinula stevensoni]CAG0905318.1 unnamed protein product [Darwinula stevensoni]
MKILLVIAAGLLCLGLAEEVKEPVQENEVEPAAVPAKPAGPGRSGRALQVRDLENLSRYFEQTMTRLFGTEVARQVGGFPAANPLQFLQGLFSIPATLFNALFGAVTQAVTAPARFATALLSSGTFLLGAMFPRLFQSFNRGATVTVQEVQDAPDVSNLADALFLISQKDQAGGEKTQQAQPDAPLQIADVLNGVLRNDQAVFDNLPQRISGWLPAVSRQTAGAIGTTAALIFFGTPISTQFMENHADGMNYKALRMPDAS